MHCAAIFLSILKLLLCMSSRIAFFTYSYSPNHWRGGAPTTCRIYVPLGENWRYINSPGPEWVNQRRTVPKEYIYYMKYPKIRISILSHYTDQII